jgi:hypothetical protein
MPELQQLPPALQRRKLFEAIEDSQTKALRKLRDAGVPEAQILAVLPRIRSYCVFVLNEYDQLYLAFEEMSDREGRSLAHQRYFNDKVMYVLRSMEAGIAEILAMTIRQAIQGVQPLPQSREVIAHVPHQPNPPAWQTVLLTTFKLLIWLIGLPASYLLVWQLTGSDFWAWMSPLLLVVFWLIFRFSWFGLAVPLSAIITAYFLYAFPIS